MYARGLEAEAKVTPPFVVVGKLHNEWASIGARPWIVRQLRFGIQIPWERKPKRTIKIPEYNSAVADASVYMKEVRRWMALGFYRRAVGDEMESIKRDRKI